jgi:hypothetical protein
MTDDNVIRLGHAEMDAMGWPRYDGTDPRVTSSATAWVRPYLDQPSPEARTPIGIYTRAASDIKSEKVDWLWRGRVPLRGLTVFAGEKGLGKSTLTNARLVAAVSRGTLDGDLSKSADVLLASAEDSWPGIVKPRLAAHGADLRRVHELGATNEHGETLLTLPDHVEGIAAAVQRHHASGSDVRLIVLDPISAFLDGAVDSHKDAHVRRALAPLAAMAEQLELAIVVVAHLGKDEGRKILNRVLGSVGFVNAARSVFGFARHPDDDDRGSRRVLVHAASNWGVLAPSVEYTIEGREVDLDDGSRTEIAYLEDRGEVDISADDLQRGGDDRESIEDAIVAELDAGERPSLEVKEAVAKRIGCSLKTVERHGVAMRDDGQLTIEEGGFPRTTTWKVAVKDTSVGTSPNSLNVPTANSPAQSQNSSRNGPSRDTQGVSSLDEGANGEATLAEAEEQRLRDKFGEGW